MKYQGFKYKFVKFGAWSEVFQNCRYIPIRASIEVDTVKFNLGN